MMLLDLPPDIISSILGKLSTDELSPITGVFALKAEAYYEVALRLRPESNHMNLLSPELMPFLYLIVHHGNNPVSKRSLHVFRSTHGSILCGIPKRTYKSRDLYLALACYYKDFEKYCRKVHEVRKQLQRKHHEQTARYRYLLTLRAPLLNIVPSCALPTPQEEEALQQYVPRHPLYVPPNLCGALALFDRKSPDKVREFVVRGTGSKRFILNYRSTLLGMCAGEISCVQYPIPGTPLKSPPRQLVCAAGGGEKFIAAHRGPLTVIFQSNYPKEQPHFNVILPGHPNSMCMYTHKSNWYCIAMFSDSVHLYMAQFPGTIRHNGLSRCWSHHVNTWKCTKFITVCTHTQTNGICILSEQKTGGSSPCYALHQVADFWGLVVGNQFNERFLDPWNLQLPEDLEGPLSLACCPQYYYIGTYTDGVVFTIYYFECPRSGLPRVLPLAQIVSVQLCMPPSQHVVPQWAFARVRDTWVFWDMLGNGHFFCASNFVAQPKGICCETLGAVDDSGFFWRINALNPCCELLGNLWRINASKLMWSLNAYSLKEL